MFLKEIELSQAYFATDMIDYKANSILIRALVKNAVCDINVMSFDNGEGSAERKNTYNSFAQIIEGNAVFVIDGISHMLETGQCIMIPAHAPNTIDPNGRFKMLLTVIKDNGNDKLLLL